MNDLQMLAVIRDKAMELCSAVHEGKSPESPVSSAASWEIYTPNGKVYDRPYQTFPLWECYKDLARKLTFPRMGSPDGYTIPSRPCTGSFSGIHDYRPHPKHGDESRHCGLCANAVVMTDERAEELLQEEVTENLAKHANHPSGAENERGKPEA